VNKFFAALFAVAFATATFAAAEPPAVIKLKAKQGGITFTHKEHQDRIKNCKACHATDEGGKIEGFQPNINKDKTHALCQTCHKKEVAANKASKAPTKCDGCHKKGT